MMIAGVHAQQRALPEIVIRHVYLHPGDILASSEPARITTILGSCVAVCLFERDGGLGGINHFLLPSSGPAPTSARYGDFATEELVSRMLAMGAGRSRLVAKLFGGANVLRAFADGSRHIGAANVEMARASLQRHRIPVEAEDVGGTRGRKLVFSAMDGAAWVKEIGA